MPAPPESPSPPAADPARADITQFLTDGSLAAIAAELSSLLGVTIRLLDTHGRQVVHVPGARGWAVRAAEPFAPSLTEAIVLQGRAIGALELGPTDDLAGHVRGAVHRVVRLLAASATEVVENEHTLRTRIKELSALHRLSGLLVRAASPDRILAAALESALDVLGLDAGSIVLMREPEGVRTELEQDIELKVSRNLSRDWLDSPLPLSRNRVFDRLALEGQIVAVEDLSADDRVLIPERARAEGLGAFINAGLVFQGRPVGILRLYARRPRTFSDADRRLLRAIAEQAALAVEQTRLMRIENEERRIQRQVAMAADVQRRMMPRAMPSHPGLDVAARYVPSFELGGDFYDLFDLHGSFGLVVGDVVGKGIAAALLMSAVRASLRAHVQDLYDLDEVIARVNTALCRDTLDNEFVTLWYGVIDPRTNRLTYCSAGHDPTLLFRHDPARHDAQPDPAELSVGGLVVGIDPNFRYQKGLVDLRPGDLLVAYTDGVTDAADFHGRKFTRDRLKSTVRALLAEEPRAPASRVVEHILWSLRQHSGLATRTDDQTLVVLRVRDTHRG